MMIEYVGGLEPNKRRKKSCETGWKWTWFL